MNKLRLLDYPASLRFLEALEELRDAGNDIGVTIDGIVLNSAVMVNRVAEIAQQAESAGVRVAVDRRVIVSEIVGGAEVNGLRIKRHW